MCSNFLQRAAAPYLFMHKTRHNRGPPLHATATAGLPDVCTSSIEVDPALPTCVGSFTSRLDRVAAELKAGRWVSMKHLYLFLLEIALSRAYKHIY